MTCGMVFFHSPIIDTVPSLGSADFFVKICIDGAIRNSVDLIMSYFFTVTGFLLFRNFNMSEFPAKIKNRVFSLLIPFILWQAILALVDTVFKYNTITFTEFLEKTFLMQRWPLNSAMWYVYAIFLLALLSPLVYLIIKKKVLGWGLIIIIMLLTEARGKIDIPIVKAILSYGYVENIVLFFPAYFAGAFYGYHFRDASSDCLFYLIPTLLIAFLLNDMIDGLFFNISLKLLPIAMIYLLPPIHFLENRKIYRLSFLMYALHQPLIWKTSQFVLDLYTAYISKIIPFAAVASILTRLIILGIDIGLAALIYFVFSKLSPRFLALLSGGRA